MEMKLFFLNDGEMGIYENGTARMLVSERKEKYIQTAHALEERNAWKYKGAGAKFQQQVNPYERASRMAETACRVTAVIPWQGHALYALLTPEMGGLYTKETGADGAEGNWLSEREFEALDLHARGDRLVCALSTTGAETHIALFRAGSPRYEVITQGDTQDTAPFLSPDGHTVYYASAGWARNEEGAPIAMGPSALLRLDVTDGSLTEVCEDARYDYLRPRLAPDGTLYFIRRPYRQNGPRRLTVGERLKNVGAFFKGVGKLFQIIGDPDGTAKRQPRVGTGGAKAAQSRMLDGELLEIAMPGPGDAVGDEGCIPDAWQLMRLNPDGTAEEVLRGAADYDFDGDALIYTDGRRIIRLADGKKTVLHRGTFITRVSVAP